jgi:hypothetical protein
MDRSLLINLGKIMKSADAIMKMQDYTSAAILYFKALFTAMDFIMLVREGKIPHDHGERFRIAERKYPDMYKTLDTLFPMYRTTYTTQMSKETALEVRNTVLAIVKKYEVPFEGFQVLQGSQRKGR